MRCRLGIAQQDHAVLYPAPAADHRKIAPHRPVDQKRITIEKASEDLRHPICGLLLAQAFEAGAAKGFRIGFEDPGRMADFVLVGVGDKGPPLRLLENKGEGVKRLGRSHPGELVGAEIDFRLEMRLVFVAQPAVAAVRQHDEVGIGKPGYVLHLALEQQGDAEFARARLQDQEKGAAGAAAKTVAADPMNRSLEVDGDVVPIGKLFRNAPVARRIVLFEVVECRVGKNYAEAKSVVGPVSLIHRDIGARALLFEKDRRIQTGGSATDDRDLHETSGPGSIQTFILSLKQFPDKPVVTPIRINCPEKPASPCARTLQRPGKNPPWSCRAPGRSPRIRLPPRPTSPIPSPAYAWSWCWRKSDPPQSRGRGLRPGRAHRPAPRCG